jgi:N,N'-diacetyllegionaminate synthase
MKNRLNKKFDSILKKKYFIAEIGGNFSNFNRAKRLMDSAKRCGADAVKIQTFKANTIATKEAFFDMENTGKISQFDYFKRYQLSNALHEKIFRYAKKINIDCFSTPSHFSDIDFLKKFKCDFYKIGSDDATNLPLIEYAAKTNKIIILSTGMCNLKEVDEAVELILKFNKKLILLHCVSSYPTYPKEVNLSVIRKMKKRYKKIIIGFSDHTLNKTASLLSVQYGAQVIEKHFTLNKKFKGPDHHLSANPRELKDLIQQVKDAELMVGDGIKKPSKTEKKNRINNRKSLVTIKNIKKGDKFTKFNLSILRPGYGLNPKYYKKLLGTKSKIDIKKDKILSRENYPF